jgi:group I intron endonuclease
MKITGIYGIRHKTADRWYVGQAYDIRKRFKDHRAMAFTKTRKHLYLSLRKYGHTAFAWRILERCEKAELNKREKFWIQKLNSVEPNGYNLTTGGDRQFEFTPTVLEKMRKASLGRVQSEETIRKRVEKNTGRKRTLATRRRMRKAQLGKTHTETTRRKMSRITAKRLREPNIRKWNRERMIKQWRNRAYRRQQRKAHRGNKPSEATRRKLGKKSSLRWKDPKYRRMMVLKLTGRKVSTSTVRKIAKSNRGKKRTPKFKKEQAERIRNLWEKPSYRRKMVKAHIGLKQTRASIKRRIKKLKGRRKYTIDDMQEWAGRKGGKCLSRKYDGAHTHLKWRCKALHVWRAKPTNIKSGKWCPYCRNENLSRRFRKKDGLTVYRKIVRKKGGTLLTKKAPRNNREHIQIRCLEKHIFWIQPNNLISGKWCKSCAVGKRRTHLRSG